MASPHGRSQRPPHSLQSAATITPQASARVFSLSPAFSIGLNRRSSAAKTRSHRISTIEPTTYHSRPANVVHTTLVCQSQQSNSQPTAPTSANHTTPPPPANSPPSNPWSSPAGAPPAAAGPSGLLAMTALSRQELRFDRHLRHPERYHRAADHLGRQKRK
jgi:hypothetical protein